MASNDLYRYSADDLYVLPSACGAGACLFNPVGPFQHHQRILRWRNGTASGFAYMGDCASGSATLYPYSHWHLRFYSVCWWPSYHAALGHIT